MNIWTKNQINFACALGKEWHRRSKIACQARANGHAIERVNWKMLVALGIAEARETLSTDPLLRRGPGWQGFFDQYALEETKRGLLGLEIEDEVNRLFGMTAQSAAPVAGGRFSGRAYQWTGGPVRLFRAKPKLTLVPPSSDRG